MEAMMKALVMVDYHKFELQEWPVPTITETQVLVKIRAVSICGSDIDGSYGRNGRRVPPIIMGHEASGDIVQIGVSVKDWKTGQRVTFDSTEYCGTCKFCRSGQINLCEHRKVLGVSCDEYRRHGAMAEYVAVEARTLYRLPDEVTYEEASLVEPLSIGFHAMAISPLRVGDIVLINGCGTIGLMTLQSVKAAGVSHIIVCDVDDARLKIAQEMGADTLINSSHEDVPECVKQLTEGRYADVAFDAVGLAETVRNAIFSLRKGGCLVTIGNISPEIQFPLQYCITRQIRVQGSCASSGEYDVCLSMIAAGKIILKPFLQNIMPLTEGKAAFDRLYAREPNLLKIILTTN